MDFIGIMRAIFGDEDNSVTHILSISQTDQPWWDLYAKNVETGGITHLAHVCTVHEALMVFALFSHKDGVRARVEIPENRNLETQVITGTINMLELMHSNVDCAEINRTVPQDAGLINLEEVEYFSIGLESRTSGVYYELPIGMRRITRDLFRQDADDQLTESQWIIDTFKSILTSINFPINPILNEDPSNVEIYYNPLQGSWINPESF